VHHGLRPSADFDAECARRTSDRLGVAFTLERVDVADGPNLEARARAARRLVLGTRALTGHTLDDQAETVLLALMRGSGASGLAAMTPGPTRPILQLRRSDTVALCIDQGLETANDPTNDDPRFRRNRVRHELLPLIHMIAERDVAPILARTADLLRDDDGLLEQLAERIDVTDALMLAGSPDAATVARVLDVASGRSAACDAGGGRRVERHQQRLVLVNIADPAS
jgi:tRNA(Ile)-lysidine synthase